MEWERKEELIDYINLQEKKKSVFEEETKYSQSAVYASQLKRQS